MARIKKLFLPLPLLVLASFLLSQQDVCKDNPRLVVVLYQSLRSSLGDYILLHIMFTNTINWRRGCKTVIHKNVSDRFPNSTALQVHATENTVLHTLPHSTSGRTTRASLWCSHGTLQVENKYCRVLQCTAEYHNQHWDGIFLTEYHAHDPPSRDFHHPHQAVQYTESPFPNSITESPYPKRQINAN